MPPLEDNTSPLPPIETPTENTDILIVCSFDCSEQNIQRCRKCNRPYCIMHANRYSPNFCKDCFSNLSLVEAKFERRHEDFNLKTNTLTVKKDTNTKYYMDGIDWPFVTAWIDTLTDEELNILIRFHYFVMKTIEAENETRRVERYRELKNAPLPARITTQKTITKTVKAVDTKEDIIKKLQKQGLPQNVIDMMVSALK